MGISFFRRANQEKTMAATRAEHQTNTNRHADRLPTEDDLYKRIEQAIDWHITLTGTSKSRVYTSVIEELGKRKLIFDQPPG